MKYLGFFLLLLALSCNQPPEQPQQSFDDGAVKALTDMIAAREKAMIEKDISAAMSQFSDDATWINSQGYYFEGKQNVLEFHSMLAETNPLDYGYVAGTPRIRIIDHSNAIVYYGWKMLWRKREDPSNITNEEIGLMTLSAQKRGDRWYWIAVTNQHTPWFYETVEPVTVHDE